MGAKVRNGEVEAAAQMFQQRLGLGLVIIERHLLIQDAPVSGLPQVGGSAGDEPQRVVVEASADVAVSLFGQRLILMVSTAILKLGGRNVQNALPCTGGDDMHKAQQILTAVAEAHATAHAALVIAGAPAHIEGDHALVLVPDVHHAVQLFLSGVQLIGREQVFPVGGQRSAGRIDLRVGGIALHHGVGAGFVDDARRDEFFLLRVLDVTQTEQDAAALSRGQLYMDVQRTNRSPAMGDAAGAMACPNGLRVCRAAIYAAECITGGVKAADGAVGPENSVVVTALTVFGLMIDSAALHLDFTGGEIALEVGAVVHSVPQAELHIAEHIQLFFRAAVVAQGQAVQLTGIAFGHKQLLLCRHTVLSALQYRVAQTMAAGVTVQFGLCWLPAGVPHRIAILDIDMVAVHIQRGAVVAVTGQPAQPRIAVKAVAAGCVGNQREEFLSTQVVDPGQRGLRGGDDVLFVLVVKMSESHNASSLKPAYEND